MPTVISVCFVAPHVFPLLSGRVDQGHFGGAEVQQVVLARELSRIGFEVSMVCLDHGQPQIHDYENIVVHKSFAPNSGIRGLRRLYPQTVKLWKAMQLANADVYYIRSSSYLVGVVRLFCRRHFRRYVYAASSDANFDPALLRRLSRSDLWMYEYGLRGADAIVTQSSTQRELLCENYGLPATILPNIAPSLAVGEEMGTSNFVLWVSTIRSLKRPMQFINLANRHPDRRFVMIGGPARDELGLYNQVCTIASTINNLEFLGPKSWRETESYFDHAQIFVNTSIYEGFPNTFLQAWVRGIPVVSYVDPDNVITRNKLGQIVKSETELTAALDKVVSEADFKRKAIVAYCQQHHGRHLIRSYQQLLESL